MSVLDNKERLKTEITTDIATALGLAFPLTPDSSDLEKIAGAISEGIVDNILQYLIDNTQVDDDGRIT